jgi:hypothetical protein
MATAPGAAPEAAYDLCVSNGDFRLKLAEVRLVLSDAGITYSLDGASGLRPWAHLTGVRIQATQGGPRSGWESAIELTFSRGRPLIVHSTGPFGRDERQRDLDYVAFVQELHRRIPEEEAQRIAFRRGIPEGRHRFLSGFVALVLALFGGFLLFVMAKVFDGTIPVTAAFFPVLAWLGILAWMVHAVLRNRPAPYDRRHLPRDLYPE